jgi:hypothetical protein
VDLLLFFSGQYGIHQVQGQITLPAARQSDLVIEDDPIVEEATITFDNGLTGRLSRAGGLHVVLTGTLGTLRIEDDGRSLKLCKHGGQEKHIEVQPVMSGTVRAFHELENAVRVGGHCSIGPQDIEVGMAILLSIAKSGIRECRPLNLNSLEDEFTVRGRFGTNYV